MTTVIKEDRFPWLPHLARPFGPEALCGDLRGGVLQGSHRPSVRDPKRQDHDRSARPARGLHPASPEGGYQVGGGGPEGPPHLHHEDRRS